MKQLLSPILLVCTNLATATPNWHCSPQATDPFSPIQLRCDDNTRLSLNTTNAPIAEILNTMATRLNGQISLPNQLKGNLTISLNHSPWQAALTNLLDRVKLTAHWQDNRLVCTQQTTTTPPPQAQLFKLNHQTASILVTTLKTAVGGNLLSEQGRLVADDQSNMLWAYDTPEILNRLNTLIQAIDKPRQQVRIQATIFSIDEDYLSELGLQLTNQANNANHSLATIGLNTAGIKILSGQALSIALSAMQQRGHGKILSNPELVTANKQTASIEVGDEIPYQEKTANGATSVVFKKAVLSLQVTPDITPTQQMTLHLKINQDKVSPALINGDVGIQTRALDTAVRVNDRQTVVLGGIYDTEQDTQTTKIPLIGDLPMLGRLFQHRQQRQRRHQILVFVTPTLIQDS